MNRYHAIPVGLAAILLGALLVPYALAPPDPSERPEAWIVYAGERGDGAYVDLASAGLDRVSRTGPFAFDEFAPADRGRLEAGLRNATARPGLLVLQDSGAWPAAADTWAAACPETKFLVIDGIVTPRPNVRSVRIASRGVSYLAGVLAASAAKGRPVALVAGMPSAVMDEYIEGFTIGVGAAAPGTQVAVRYVGETTRGFADPAAASAISEECFRNGTVVIYAACGGSSTGVIEAAGRSPGRFVIGIDRDQADLGPTVVLASAVKRVDRVVERGLRDHANGTFVPGDAVIGLDGDATGLVLNPRFAHLAPVLEQHRAAAGGMDR